MTDATPRPCKLCGFVNPRLLTGWATEPAHYVLPDAQTVRAVSSHDGLVEAVRDAQETLQILIDDELVADRGIVDVSCRLEQCRAALAAAREPAP